ncbi:MAG TPA: MFS transporter [Candidatus Binatia bacterium]|nr:MFS transporter [Candidatus Binatia bacterium]
MGAYRRVLRDRRFALLWGGLTVSLFGDDLTWVSLVWLTFELGGGPADLGILAVCYTAPVIVGGLVAGVLLDRFDRRRLLIADNTIRGLAMLSVPIAAAMGALGQAQIDLVAAVYGLLYMISLAGFPSIIPDLVPGDDLSTANALESLSFSIGGVAGPALAGLLIGLIGAANNLAIDAATYFFFVACLLVLRLPGRAPVMAEAGLSASPGEHSPAESTGTGLRPAIRFILRSPAILAITLMYMAVNVGEGMIVVILPVYVRDLTDAGAIGYGILVSAFTVGSLAGALVVGAIRWPWALGRSIAAAEVAAGVVVALLIVEPPLLGAALVLVVVGICASPLTIWAQTIRMRLIPVALRGRVFALLRTLMQSTPPVGGLVAGLLLASAAGGAGATGATGGIAVAVAAVALLTAIPGLIGLVHPALGRAATADPPSDATPTTAMAAGSPGPD